MFKINSITFTIITILLFFCSCKNEQKIESNPQWDYDNIKAYGASKTDSYIFCSIVEKKITYNYKIGNWTFYSPQKIKVAEGTYDVSIVKINDQGGCPYAFYENSVDKTKWKFWDSNGKPIKVNKRDLDYIASFE